MIKRSSELAFNAGSRQTDGAFARDHEDIRSRPQSRAATAEILADLSLDPIANHGIAHFAAHSDSQSRLRSVVRATDDDETRRLKLCAGARQF
jgi:hypothetical protein